LLRIPPPASVLCHGKGRSPIEQGGRPLVLTAGVLGPAWSGAIDKKQSAYSG